MNPLAKKFRIASGILILLNVVAIFFPFATTIRENYTLKGCSELQYFNFNIEICGPFDPSYASSRLIWGIIFVILPVIFSIVIGVLSIVIGERQKFSSLLPVIIFIMYLASPIVLSMFNSDWEYTWGPGLYMHIIVSAASMLVGLLGVVVKSPMEGEEIPVVPFIPGIEEIKKEQIEAKYNIVETKEPEKEAMITLRDPEGNAIPRGVLLGLAGIYAGAEIPFADGECIKLGRTATNDLVFDGQEKVSRNHCYIKWDAAKKVFLICDYSSNGTFVNGSEDCLPQNLEIAVEPGTILAIGDEQNTFRLE